MRCVVFESSVILDGTQTQEIVSQYDPKFESSVILDGTQTGSRSPVQLFFV